MTTSDEWTPSDIACAQAASTAGNPSCEDGGENGDHLTIAVIGSGELTPNSLQRGRQHPVLEWRAVA